MRRSAAALAATVLATLAVAGPLAATSHSAPATIQCGAGATSPECVLLDDLAAQLQPLAPVLSLAGPTLSQLLPGVIGLAGQSDTAAGVPTADVAAQVDALLTQLGVLPEPVRDLLAAAQLDGLTTTLEALLAEVTAPVVGTKPAQTSKPTPAKTAKPAPASGPATATGSGAPTLGGSLSAPDGSGSPTVSPSIPDVPMGDSLTLGPLALPDFGFSSTIGADEGDDELAAAPTEADAVPLELEQAAALPGDGNGTQVGVVVVLSLLLCGGAFAAQVRENRHTIPD